MLVHKYVKTLRQIEALKDEIFRQRQDFERQINLHLVQMADLCDEHQIALLNKDLACRKALRKIHEEAFLAGAMDERQAMRNKPELMLRVSPCIQLIQQPHLLQAKRSCEFCLHYQMILRGFPCLEPHVQLLERQSGVDVEYEWDGLLKKAREMTKALMDKSFDEANYLVEFCEDIVINTLSSDRELLETITMRSSSS